MLFVRWGTIEYGDQLVATRRLRQAVWHWNRTTFFDLGSGDGRGRCMHNKTRCALRPLMSQMENWVLGFADKSCLIDQTQPC